MLNDGGITRSNSNKNKKGTSDEEQPILSDAEKIRIKQDLRSTMIINSEKDLTHKIHTVNNLPLAPLNR